MPSNFTDPNYKQLISHEELIQPTRTGKKQRNRYEKYRDDCRQNPASDCRPEGPFRDYAEHPSNPSHGASFVKRFFDALVNTSDPWRLSMGFAVMFMMINTGSSRGWISIPGLEQFASAESVTEIRVEQLDGQIEDAVRAHCAAPTQEAKGYYFRRLKELKDKYRKASTDKYEPPTCSDLGVREIKVGEP